ncbi:hypothetical protein D3C85_1603240 [compost metagenome]
MQQPLPLRRTQELRHRIEHREQPGQLGTGGNRTEHAFEFGNSPRSRFGLPIDHQMRGQHFLVPKRRGQVAHCFGGGVQLLDTG